MKIFTFGRALRLSLLAGGIYYVRKNGGFKAAWNKVVEQANQVKDQLKDPSTTSPMRSMYESDSGFASAPSYGDSGSSSSYGNEISGSTSDIGKGYNRG